ncbi:MAG: hypothetical protein A2V83_11400 [Nitrospirae bacterium RBG_16_64_22]|nr:MAG: hypothetical protein A2V83_11400 [Nitrospirae bacterium RBG_16_64_22]
MDEKLLLEDPLLSGLGEITPVWIQIWQRNTIHIVAFSVFLAALILLLVFRDRLVRHPRWRDRARNTALVVSAVYMGLVLGTQPATTYILIAAQNLKSGMTDLTFYLMDPFIFFSFAFILLTVFLWGRGAFCGWLCPFGSFLELLYKGYERLFPRWTWKVPPAWHDRLVYLKYFFFVLILGVSFYDFYLAEYMAEVEPFKTYVVKLNRGWIFVAWFGLVVVSSMLVYRSFCRYVCPLGGMLAFPARLTSIFPLVKLKRYDYCGTCRIGERLCDPQAIRRDGSIDAAECLYCLDCQVNYYDEELCPVLLLKAKGRAPEPPPLATRPPRASRRKAERMAAAGLAVLLLAPGTAFGATLVVGKEAGSIGEALKRARPGDTIDVPAGTYRELVQIERRVRLTGRPGAVIDGGGEGPVVGISAAGAVVEGFTIRNAPATHDTHGAGVLVIKGADGAVIRNNRIENTNYGVWVTGANGVAIEKNEILGKKELDVEARGNGVLLNAADGAVVRENVVRDARDGVYLEITHGARIEKNDIERSRYSIHTMWCDRGVFNDNRMAGNLVGLALMYSKGSEANRNVSVGNSTQGIVAIQMIRSRMVGNVLIGNTKGLFLYNSILNKITDNLIANNNLGVHSWGGSEENEITRNTFFRNEIQVKHVASRDERWDGNFWSDYMGWDTTRDGKGDIPYESNTLVDALLWRYPAARLLLFSPSLQFLWMVEKQFPILRAPRVVDREPAMEPMFPRWTEILAAHPGRPAKYYGEMEKLPHMPGG